MPLGTADKVSSDDAGSVDMRLMWSHPLGRVVARPKSGDRPARMIMMLDPAVRAERAQDREAIVALGRAIERLECEQMLPIRAVRQSPMGRLVVETEAANGSSLSALMEVGPLAVERAVGILRQVAHGLAVAHTGGVMHGALSLASVIVDGDRGDVVRLVDFGLGRLSWEALERAPATQPTSPERVLGLVATPAEDVYLFGCVAYTVLAGRAPFEDGAAAELRRRHAIEDAPDLAEAAKGRQLPAPIVAVVMRCLAKESEDRYADGSSLEIAWCEAQIEAGIGTRWDDLPLPAMAEDDRAALIRGLGALATASPPAPSVEARSPPARAPARSRPRPRPPAPPRASTPASTRPPSPPPPVEALLPSSTEASTVRPATAEPEPASAAPAEVIAIEEEEPLTARIPVAAPEPAKRRSALPWVALVGGLVGLGVAGAVVMGAWESAEPTSVVATPSSPVVERPDRTVPADELVAPAEPDAVVDAEPELVEPEVEPAEAEPAEVEPAEVEPTARGERAVDAATPEERDATAPEASEPSEPKADVTELMQRARQKRDAGQNAAAEALYEQVLARQPRHKGALCALGELAFAKGNATVAAKYFTRASKVSPKDGDIRIQLGDALFKLGRLEKARVEFAKAAATGHPLAIRRLQIVDAKLGQ